ncbi:hypothetical protein JRQ81_019013 [Phrynocephalus forsythii]|uniref:Uncharacterized protein n=1 Tax=Phrynocephalus forsythii TaxID=171643 RepID=A0A9Q0XSZ2_9SAUR|nr:hypothetical protein JRQ81_019013 [Phrynocephalus forsythii]
MYLVSEVQHGCLSLMAHWWHLEDLRSDRALVAGLQGEALILPPGYKSILLQVQHAEAQATGRNITNELLSTLQQRAPDGVIHGHMLTGARHMLVALNTAKF